MLWTQCLYYYLPLPPNFYVEILMSSMRLLGGGAFGRWLGQNGSFMTEISVLTKEARERPVAPCARWGSARKCLSYQSSKLKGALTRQQICWYLISEIHFCCSLATPSMVSCHSSLNTLRHFPSYLTAIRLPTKKTATILLTAGNPITNLILPQMRRE